MVEHTAYVKVTLSSIEKVELNEEKCESLLLWGSIGDSSGYIGQLKPDATGSNFSSPFQDASWVKALVIAHSYEELENNWGPHS